MYEYDIEGDYGFGWEIVTCETEYSKALARLSEYRQNEPGVPFRINKVKATV